ncbi:hypothetical protein D3C77_419380 [compost metagenome]
MGQQAQRADCRALDDAQRVVAVHHVQQFIAPATQAVGLTQQLRGIFQHGVQCRAGCQVRADVQPGFVVDDAGRIAQCVAGGMRGPAAAAARYI